MQIKVLGPFEVVDDGRIVDVGGLKQRAVLALLTMEANRVISLDRLIDQLWGDEPPPRATGSLQAYISNLRRALEPNRPPRTPPSVLVTQPPGYVLRVEPQDIDAGQFEQLAAEGRRLLDGGRPADAKAVLQRALALWRGPALADFAYESYARAEAARLDELRVVALEDSIEAELALGQHAVAVAELERLVVEQPLRERLWGMLMLALYRSGRQAEALRAYTHARTTLTDELGIDPGPALQRLEDEILRQDPSLDWQAGLHQEPVDVRPAGARAATTVAPSKAPITGPPPEHTLVGRHPQLTRLTTVLAAVDAGRPQLVLLSGEPGIGKTRLAEELATHAAANGAVVTWGRCYEGEGAPPFWPWLQVLKGILDGRSPDEVSALLGRERPVFGQLVPELAGPAGDGPESAPPSDAGAARFQLYDAFTSLLARAGATRPLVVVVDDLHWADVASLRLLQYLGAELHHGRVLIVATFREGEVSVDHPLTEALAELARQPVTERVALSGLSAEDVGHYIEETTGTRVGPPVAAAVHSRTDGNPFFVAELVRLLASEGMLAADRQPLVAAVPVPAGVRDVIRRRIARLPEDAQAVLMIAAVIGREFTVEALEEASGLDIDRVLDLLETALVTGIVVEVPEAIGRYRFAHALTRETLYDGLTKIRRARLHGQVGVALEKQWQWQLDAHLNELAHHFAEGAPVGHAEKALEYATRAATQARAGLAFEESARQWERALAALRMLRPNDRETRYDLLIRLAQTRKSTGNVTAAREALASAAELARDLDDPQRLARVALNYSGGGWWGWWSDVNIIDYPAMDILQEALDRLGPEDSVLTASVLSTLAVVLYYTPEVDRRNRLAAEAAAMGRRVADSGRLAVILLNVLVATWGPDGNEERQLLIEEILDHARAGGMSVVENATVQLKAGLALEGGDIETFWTVQKAGRARTEKLGRAAAGHLVWIQSMVEMMEGKFAEAEKLIEENWNATRRLSEHEVMRTYMAQLNILYREQGRSAEIVEALREVVAGDRNVHMAWRSALALALADCGEIDAAQAEFEIIAAADFQDIPRDFTWGVGMATRAELAHEINDVHRAKQLYELIEPFAGRFIVLYTRELFAGSYNYFLGSLASTLQRWDDSERILTTAIEENQRIGTWPYVARSKLRLGQMLLRRGGPGDADRAAVLLAEAEALAGEMGMKGVAAEAQRSLAR